MTVQEGIEKKLREGLQPLLHLEVINESSGHNVPAGSESHFKVIAVAAKFDGLSRVARHRAVNDLLRDELAGPVHALALHLFTEVEWEQRNREASASPACRGGSGA